MDTKEEKEKLLNDYREALGEKDCKYFKQVSAFCFIGGGPIVHPFCSKQNNWCFVLIIKAIFTSENFGKIIEKLFGK